jgi:hypothetical protein
VRRQPENGVLHRVLREHLESFLEDGRARGAGEKLPAFVERELQQEVGSSLGSHLVGVRFEKVSDETIVRAVVRGPNPPSATQVAAMEDRLPSPPDGTRVRLRIRFVQLMIIDRDGEVQSDQKFGSDE